MPLFSQRFHAIGEGLNPLAEALAEQRAAGQTVVDLTQSNPTLAGIAYPREAISAALSRPECLEYHPSAQGLVSARQAVCAYYAARGQIVAPEDLFLTASTSEAYAFLFKLLCDPGDAVCVPTPSYPLFNYIAELENVSLRTYPLCYGPAPGGGVGERWRLDPGSLQQALASAKALILVNPNNPTGSVLTAGELDACREAARAQGAALIVDEVFSDYCFGETRYVPAASDTVLTFTLNGFSKVLGMPQLKLGWIHVAGPEPEKRRARELLELIADTFLSVNTPVQVASPGLLTLRGPIQEQIRDRSLSNCRTLAGVFAACPTLKARTPEGGWYALLELDSVESDERVAVALLRTAQVYTHPGHFFGFDAGCRLVISLLPREEEFRTGCDRIRNYAEQRML